MPMRLLPKSEINTKKAQEKRVEIDEGLKLARRVDNLREIAAQEEASLASFRSTTLKAIAKEVKEAETKRAELLKQVQELRNEIAEGTKVLDVRQKQLIEHQKTLENQEKSLKNRIQALKTLTVKVQERDKESENYHNRLIYAHKIMEEMHKSVDATYQEAKQYCVEAVDRQQKITHLAQVVEEELKTRDIAVASKERDFTIREEHFERRKEELRIKELNLIDREKTLEREIKRLKEKYGNSSSI